MTQDAHAKSDGFVTQMTRVTQGPVHTSRRIPIPENPPGSGPRRQPKEF